MKPAVKQAKKASTKETPLPAALGPIDAAAEAHAIDYQGLKHRMAVLQNAIDQLKAEAMPDLRELVAAAKLSHANLVDAINATPGAFDKPRTRVLHGLKVGLRKQEGKTVFRDEELSIALIEMHLVDQADVLISTKKSIVKDAASQLPADLLKKIGGTIEDATDEVVIAPVEGDVMKLVDALIKES